MRYFDSRSPKAPSSSEANLGIASNGTEVQVSTLWSFEEMLRIYATKYVDMGQDFQEIEMLADRHAGTELVDDENLGTLVNLVFSLGKHCDEIGLVVSRKIIDTIQKHFSSLGFLPWKVVGNRIAELRRCFTAELGSMSCYMLTSERVKFYSDDASQFVSNDALVAFPSSRYDLTEAGKCFATERFTASVTHLMKVAEWPLISFASYAKVPESERRNWNTALNQIHSKITKKEEPFNSFSKTDEEYFIGLEGFLRSAKTAWRNPSSHIPRIYIESQARSLFEVIRILMDNAAKRLKEDPMV
jgi:hypothetical protein